MKTRQQVGFCHALTLFVITLILGGCATIKPPPLNSNMAGIDVSKESIALLTVKIANKYKTGYQPDIKSLLILTNEEQGRKEFSFSVDEKYNEVRNAYNEYLISFQLPAGDYKLYQLFARSGMFPVTGTFVVPLYSCFSIKPQTINYLGHIDATVIKRMDDNTLLAGPVIPLIDQAVIGASGGTFVITITDQYEMDIKLFEKKYPYLAKHKVENHTLPQWKQPPDRDL